MACQKLAARPVYGGCGGENFCGVRCAADGNWESKFGTGLGFLRRFPLWKFQYWRGSKCFHSGKRRAEKFLSFPPWKNAELAQIRGFPLWKVAQQKVSVLFRPGKWNSGADQVLAALENGILDHFRRFPLRKMAHLPRYPLQFRDLPDFSRSETSDTRHVAGEKAETLKTES